MKILGVILPLSIGRGLQTLHSMDIFKVCNKLMKTKSYNCNHVAVFFYFILFFFSFLPSAASGLCCLDHIGKKKKKNSNAQ